MMDKEGYLTNETDDEGNLKWSCNSCDHIWFGYFFLTFEYCPECESEDIGHW